MKIFALLIMLSFHQLLFGQDTLRALFIGNSYSNGSGPQQLTR